MQISTWIHIDLFSKTKGIPGIRYLYDMISFASHPQKLILILPRFPKKPQNIPRARKQAPCRWQFKALSCSADRLQEDLGPQPLFLHPPRAPVGTALAWSSPVTYWQVLPTTNINPALLMAHRGYIGTTPHSQHGRSM